MLIRMETERLILRGVQQTDADRLHEICNQPHILKWMPDWETSIMDTKRWIAWTQYKYKASKNGKLRIMLTLALKGTGEPIGIIGIANKKEMQNKVEFGYFLSEPYTGQGFMTEAALKMIPWVFHTYRMEELIALIEPLNYPSLNLIERCGFQKLKEVQIEQSVTQKPTLYWYYRLDHLCVKDSCI